MENMIAMDNPPLLSTAMPGKKTIFKVIKGIIITKSSSKSSPMTINKSSATPQYVERSEYLMVCLFAAIPDNEVLKFLPSDQVSPIVIQFSNNCTANGAFENTYIA